VTRGDTPSPHSIAMSSTQLMDTNCMTLNRFILQEQQQFPLATGDLTNLLNSIVTAVKAISTAVRRAGMTNMFGISGDQNATGDSVQKLDVLSNELFINMLKSTFACAGMVSEENEGIIEVETKSKGKYYVYFDPLDGSSNIDCLVSIGSIFGIARKTGDDLPKDILKAGNEYIVSGYTLYGSATMLVLTTGNGVNGFTLDPSIGEFLLTDANMKIKPRGKIYSLNEGYASQWSDPVRKYIDSLKFPEGKKSRTVLAISDPWWPMSTEHSSMEVFLCILQRPLLRTASCVSCTNATRCRTSSFRPVVWQSLEMATRICWTSFQHRFTIARKSCSALART